MLSMEDARVSSHNADAEDWVLTVNIPPNSTEELAPRSLLPKAFTNYPQHPKRAAACMASVALIVGLSAALAVLFGTESSYSERSRAVLTNACMVRVFWPRG